MKKVFSLKKYVKDMANDEELLDILVTSIKSGWPQRCDGLTVKEARRFGYDVDDEDWLAEVKD